jgi:hypothetical protein
VEEEQIVHVGLSPPFCVLDLGLKNDHHHISLIPPP